MMGETAKLPDGSMFEFWEDETVYDIVLHVNSTHPDADDRNAGTLKAPLKTIQAAAERAVPGTRVLIHGGEYREWVHPVCGGINASHMISYEAYGDGEVVIKASEKVENFRPSNGWRLYNNFGKKKEEAKIKVWEYCLEPNLFLGYNPFCAVNILHDRLFIEYDKTDMTTYLNRRGMVFCDGKPLTQDSLCNGLGEKDGTYWVEANGQRVHFRLWNDEDPADHRIEVTCREQCFAPDEPFLSYIKVKGYSIDINITMKDVNPIGFTYGDTSNEYVYYFTSIDNAYFLSAYGKTNYLEDRAVIFSDLMTRTFTKDYYADSTPINKKAKLISSQIKEHFNTLSNTGRYYWDRFL